MPPHVTGGVHFIALTHRSTITIWYAASEFILQEYSSCTSSGKKIINSPDATDTDISPLSRLSQKTI